MTAAERVEECENEEGEVQAEERAEESVNEGGEVQAEAQADCPVEHKEEAKEAECPAEQTVVKRDEEPASDSVVTVDSVITVDTFVEQDGKVEETCHEEVNVKLSFTPEEPMPYGPDESLENGQDDEEECGFCLFMKAGPCGKRFAAWEACVDDAETAGINIVEKCAQKTHYLKDCMEANPEYYGPVLQAEKAIDEQASMEGSKTGTEDNPSNLEPIPA